MTEPEKSPTLKAKEDYSPYRDEAFNFPEAMRELLQGVKVTKLEWDNDNIYLTIYNGFLMIKLEDGLLHQLIVSEGDMQGVDWVVLPEVNSD